MPNRLPKTKCLSLVKMGDSVDGGKPLSKQLVTSEFGGPSPFEHLELMSNEVFLPILSNPLNQQRWGEVATREIMDRFHSFLSSTTILCGQIKGETRLPMPPLDVNGAASGKNRISLLEGAIITWTKQIKNVLKQDPESQLKAGMDPTPDVEVSVRIEEQHLYVHPPTNQMTKKRLNLTHQIPHAHTQHTRVFSHVCSYECRSSSGKIRQTISIASLSSYRDSASVASLRLSMLRSQLTALPLRDFAKTCSAPASRRTTT